MTRPNRPEVDGRRRADLLEESTETARSYVPEWDPESEDVGAALLGLFAEITEGVVERLDRALEKHHVEFFDALGFSRKPPQPARLPLVFSVADGVEGTVAVSEGTRATAEAEENRPEQTFEITEGEGFEATPAALRRIYSVNPGADAVFEHWTSLQEGTETHLFSGENLQEHALYIGHGDLLNVQPGTTVQVQVRAETRADGHVFRNLIWEYYGTENVHGEETEGWQQLLRTPDPRGEEPSPDGSVTIEVTLPSDGEILETTLPQDEGDAAGRQEGTEGMTVTEIATRWIRCRTPEGSSLDNLFDVDVESISLSLVERADGLTPDTLLYNDVPLPAESDTKTAVYPFGETPRPLDTFSIASEEAFTKQGTRVTVEFVGMTVGPVDVLDSDGNDETNESEGTDGQDSPAERDFDLSWEYWNGSAWARLDGLDGELSEGAVTFAVPDDLESTVVSGHDGHWIRARLLADGRVRYEDKDGTWEMVTEVVPRFETVTIRYKDSPPTETPEHLVAFNNREYSDDRAGDDGFSPFTRLPDAKQTLYLGFDGALDNGPIQLLFSAADKAFPEGFYPRARWEFCVDPERDEWVRLSAQDGTESLTRRGIVALVFSEPTTAFERFGHDHHWIRARLVGDEFVSTVESEGRPGAPSVVVADIDAEGERVVIENTGGQRVDLSGYRIDFEYNQPAVQVKTFPSGTRIDPGSSLVVATGTKSTGGADVQFDYRRWVLNNEEVDTVALLTPEGELVTATVDRPDDRSDTPNNTRTPASFHLAARGRDESARKDGPVDDDRADGVSADEEAEIPPKRPDPCDERLVSLVFTSNPIATPSPPRLRGVYPNAGWADNVRTVTGEVVGSSDGSPDQTFAFANRPVTQVELWVDELSALSEVTRDALKRAQPDDIEEVTDSEGVLTAFWVRWTPVEDFLDSAADARHYALDRTPGVLVFGDGQRGKIPPRGRDSIRASYRTGGGVDGNVEQNVVTGVESSIPFVETVTNPEPGRGGTNGESRTETLDRAPKALKDRGRAVAEADFERVAAAASRALARVRCVPGMDATGASRAGWVTLLLVPNTKEPKPEPSVEVKERVVAALSERAPTVLTGSDRLVVRGPSYVEVSVETTLIAQDTGSVSTVEEAAIESVEGFLHPLTGGPAGEGWEFGELPCLSDFYALLEGVDGIDHVEELAIEFRGRDASVTVREGEPVPGVAMDALIFSGTHEIRVEGVVPADVDTELPEER